MSENKPSSSKLPRRRLDQCREVSTVESVEETKNPPEHQPSSRSAKDRAKRKITDYFVGKSSESKIRKPSEESQNEQESSVSQRKRSNPLDREELPSKRRKTSENPNNFNTGSSSCKARSRAVKRDETEFTLNPSTESNTNCAAGPVASSDDNTFTHSHPRYRKRTHKQQMPNPPPDNYSSSRRPAGEFDFRLQLDPDNEEPPMSHSRFTLAPLMLGISQNAASSQTSGASGVNGGIFQEIITSLQSNDDASKYVALNELCQLLLMGNEESLPNFPIRQLVTLILDLIPNGCTEDNIVLSCRALCYMMDALPRSISIVSMGVPHLMQCLQEFSVIDVPEQALVALEIIARRNSKSVLLAGGIKACVNILDFLSLTAQRNVLSVIASCSNAARKENFEFVLPFIPCITRVLTFQDKKCIEHACIAVSRLINNLRMDVDILEQIATTEVLLALQQILDLKPSTITNQAFYTVIRSLTILCASRPSAAIFFREQCIEKEIYQLFVASADPVQKRLELTSLSPSDTYDIVSFVEEILPVLSDESLCSIDSVIYKNCARNLENVVWQWRDENGDWHSYMPTDSVILEAAQQNGDDEVTLSIHGKMYTVDLESLLQISDDTGTTRSVQRITQADEPVNTPVNIKEDPRLTGGSDVFTNFIQTLFDVLYEVYCSTSGSVLKQKCLRVLIKMVSLSSLDVLTKIATDIAISSHLTSLLASNDEKLIVCAFQMAFILAKRLPDVFLTEFVREGVVYHIQQLANFGIGIPTTSSSQSTLHASESFPAWSAQESTQPSVSSSNVEENTTESDGCRVLSNSELKRALRSSEESRTTRVPRFIPPFGMMNSPVSVEANAPDHRISGILRRQQQLGSSNPFRRLSSRRISRGNSLSEVAARGFSRADPNALEDSVPYSMGGATTFLHCIMNSWASISADRSRRTLNSGSSRFDENSKAARMTSAKDKEKICSWIRTKSSEFLKSFYNGTTILCNSQKVLSSLKSAVESLSIDSFNGDDSLKQLCSIMTAKISVFEMIHSGLINKLKEYLSSDGKCDRMMRIQQFLNVFTEVYKDSFSRDESKTKAFLLLVKKLNVCVSQTEQFPVKTSDVLTSGAMRLSSLGYLAKKQFKIQLLRHPDCNYVRNWRAGLLKVDPMTTIGSIERYLLFRGIFKQDPSKNDDESDISNESDVDEMISMLSNTSNHRLEFLLNDQVLPYSMTIFQAFRMHETTSHSNERVSDNPFDIFFNEFISKTFVLYYRKRLNESSEPKAQPERSSKKGVPPQFIKSKRSTRNVLWLDGIRPEKKYFINENLCMNAMVSIRDPSVDALHLLHILNVLNHHWHEAYHRNPHLSSTHIISRTEFMNARLTSKVNGQIRDPFFVLTNQIPTWVSEVCNSCPFLLPFEVRQNFFYITAFDRDRVISKLIESNEGSIPEPLERLANRVDKKKAVVSRYNLLADAEKLFEHLNMKPFLEIVYDSEVGVGLGPTHEFYALVSQELQRCDLNLWRNTSLGHNATHVHCPYGLFPSPIPHSTKAGAISKLKSKFKFIGKLMGKAVLDFKMLDLPMNVVAFKWLLGLENYICFQDLQYIDPEMFIQLNELYKIAHERQQLMNNSSSTSNEKLLLFDETHGPQIDELQLDFTLPGYPGYELKKGSKNMVVDVKNLMDYLELVAHWSMVEGVRKQMEALRDGFNSVISVTKLKCFYPDELSQLLCGEPEQPWTVAMLHECTRCDHGYTHESQAIQWLFEIMSCFSRDEQRKFLQFITGSPSLPVGGFRSLTPTLTIVRTSTTTNDNSDCILPSVMTCANYLKLPNYSSKEMLQAKLTFAINEGQRSFHLS